jgi:hypothetical protein
MNQTTKSHAADLSRSDRLQRLHKLLSQGGIFTTATIQRFTKSNAVHTDIHELRQNGKRIPKAIYFGIVNGNKVYGYRMLKDEVAA